jgi:hypothetical protein
MGGCISIPLGYHQPQPEPQLGSIIPSPYRLVNGANWSPTTGHPNPSKLKPVPPRPQPAPDHACTGSVDHTVAAMPAPATINFLITRKYLLHSDCVIIEAFNITDH